MNSQKPSLGTLAVVIFTHYRIQSHLTSCPSEDGAKVETISGKEARAD